MRINQIAAKGLKGLGFRHDLTPMTFIVGDNGSGKSAIADAIKISLLGKHPVLGATNTGIFQLCHGDSLEVEITMEPKEVWESSWKKSGSRIKATHTINEDQEKILKGLIPTCLDFRAFSEAKPTERQRLLEMVMGEQEDQSQPISARLAGLGTIAKEAIGNSLAATYNDYETTCATAKREIGQEVKRLKGALEQSAVDEATEMMIETEEPVDQEEIKNVEFTISQLDQKIGEQAQIVNSITEEQMRAPERPLQSEPTTEELVATKKRLEENFEKIELASKSAEHNAPILYQVREVEASLKTTEGFSNEEKPSEPTPDLEHLKNLVVEYSANRAQAIRDHDQKENLVVELKSKRDSEMESMGNQGRALRTSNEAQSFEKISQTNA